MCDYDKKSLIEIAKAYNNIYENKIDHKKMTKAELEDEIQMRYWMCENKKCWLKDIKSTKNIKASPKEARRKVKTGELDTDDINFEMNKASTNFYYIGALPSDIYKKCVNRLFPKSLTKRQKIGAIFNTERYGEEGTHWVAVHIDRKERRTTYFDSLNKKPNLNIAKSINFLCEECEINRITAKKSKKSCGRASIDFLKKYLSSRK
jgi:hypothetical protein